MPLRLQVTIDPAAMAALAAPGGMIDQATARAAGRTRDRAKQNLTTAGRVDTGALRQSIMTERSTNTATNQITYAIGSPLPYALFNERGTGIHGPHGSRIYPRRARVLRFKPGKNSTIIAGPDGYVYAASVKGIEGVHFLAAALNDLTVADFA